MSIDTSPPLMPGTRSEARSSCRRAALSLIFVKGYLISRRITVIWRSYFDFAMITRR